MPTSSQSQILSVVDYQALQQQQQQQQQASGQDGTTAKLSSRISVDQTPTIETKRRQSKDDHRPSTGKKDESPPPASLLPYRRSSTKINDGKTFSFLNVLDIQIINLLFIRV